LIIDVVVDLKPKEMLKLLIPELAQCVENALEKMKN